MAQFISFDKEVTVKGATVLAVVNALPTGQKLREDILSKHGISDIDPDKWYKQQDWLDGFKEIYDKLGDKTLYTIGRAIPDNAEFPPEIKDLHAALNSIDVAYKMNHTGGEIGYYKLLEFDKETHHAVFECSNPYPSEFDRGIIMAMLRKFKPSTSYKYDVVIDRKKESRLRGGNKDTFIVSW